MVYPVAGSRSACIKADAAQFAWRNIQLVGIPGYGALAVAVRFKKLLEPQEDEGCVVAPGQFARNGLVVIYVPDVVHQHLEAVVQALTAEIAGIAEPSCDTVYIGEQQIFFGSIKMCHGMRLGLQESAFGPDIPIMGIVQESSGHGKRLAAEIVRKRQSCAPGISLQYYKVIGLEDVVRPVTRKGPASREADEMDMVAAIETGRGWIVLRAVEY